MLAMDLSLDTGWIIIQLHTCTEYLSMLGSAASEASSAVVVVPMLEPRVRGYILRVRVTVFYYGLKTRLDWGFLARHDLYIPARLDFTFPYVWRHPFIQPSNCLCIILSIYFPIFTSSLKQRLTYNKDDLGIIMNLPDSEIIIWSNFQVL